MTSLFAVRLKLAARPFDPYALHRELVALEVEGEGGQPLLRLRLDAGGGDDRVRRGPVAQRDVVVQHVVAGVADLGEQGVSGAAPAAAAGWAAGGAGRGRGSGRRAARPARRAAASGETAGAHRRGERTNMRTPGVRPTSKRYERNSPGRTAPLDRSGIAPSALSVLADNLLAWPPDNDPSTARRAPEREPAARRADRAAERRALALSRARRADDLRRRVRPMMRELNELEAAFPALRTPDSPTQQVGGPPSTTFAAGRAPAAAAESGQRLQPRGAGAVGRPGGP